MENSSTPEGWVTKILRWEIKEITTRLKTDADVLKWDAIKDWLENHKYKEVEYPKYDRRKV